MSTLTLLAQFQDRTGLPPLGSAELKSIGVLKELLAGGEFSSALPFAIGSFLLDEQGLAEAVRDGIVSADEPWIAAARKPGDLTSHWTPRGHPQVPSAVIRALALAEAARRFWVALHSGDASPRISLDRVRALADEWRAREPSVPPRLGDVVALISGAAAPARGPTQAGPEWLVSVSIDVAGSTEAKTRLKNLDVAPEQQRQFLELFYRLFLQREFRFYDQLTKTDGAYRLAPLALEKVFYVKGIGDEVWLLIEPSGFDREYALHLLARLLNAAQAALSNPIVFAATAIEEGPWFDPDDSERAAESGYEQLDLPFKVFIDKVDGAYPIAEQRAAALGPWLNTAVDDGRVAYRDFAKVANRIGAGTGTLTAGTWRNAIRTDYIGHEIDRLFRAAKKARPLLVTVGQNLWGIADPDAPRIPDGSIVDRSLMVRCDPRCDTASRGLTYRVRPETIPAADMKGIGEDYRVYHVFESASLRANFARAEIVRKLEAKRAAVRRQPARPLPQFVRDMERLREFMNDPSLHPVGIDDSGNEGHA